MHTIRSARGKDMKRLADFRKHVIAGWTVQRIAAVLIVVGLVVLVVGVVNQGRAPIAVIRARRRYSQGGNHGKESIALAPRTAGTLCQSIRHIQTLPRRTELYRSLYYCFLNP